MSNVLAIANPWQTASSAGRQNSAAPEMSDVDRSFLSLCRRAAEETRRQPQFDPSSIESTALKLRAMNSELPDTQKMVEWLLHFMRLVFARAPRFYHLDAAETSFDEAWLLALYRAHRRKDDVSMAFLLNSRLTASQARCLGGYLSLLFKGIQ